MGIVERVASKYAARRLLDAPVKYAVGDIIEVETIGGKIRRVLVQYREDDIKDGQPGFEGLIVSAGPGGGERGAAAWGYDDRVLRRVGRAPAGLERSLEKGEPPSPQ
jgi:hypothetical protein